MMFDAQCFLVCLIMIPLGLLLLTLSTIFFLGQGSNGLNVVFLHPIIIMIKIEDTVRCFRVPPHVGRIPYRISSNYGGFTASQWRNWITIYSPVVLKRILEQQHLQWWLLFVRADLFLITLCRKFEHIYGGDQFTFHMHLKQCLTDFGPSHSFWCFSFERFNGLLGCYSTNKKVIEVQVMRRFCTAKDTYNLPYIDSDLQNVLQVSKKGNKSLSIFGADDSATISLLNTCHASSSISSFENCGVVTLLPPLKEQVLTFEECSRLRKIYTQLVPTATMSHISHFYIHCKQVAHGGDIIGSVKCGSASSVIMVYWPSQGDDLSNIDYTSRMSVGVVQHYVQHTVSMTSPTETESHKYNHVFARVSWKQRHPSEDLYGASATVCFDSFEASNACVCIPVQRIYGRSAYAKFPIQIGPVTEHLFVACPLPMKYCGCGIIVRMYGRN